MCGYGASGRARYQIVPIRGQENGNNWVSLYSVVPCGVAVYPGSETASYVLFTSPLGRHASVRLPREVFSDVGVVARKYFITRSFNMSQSGKLFSRVSPWQEGTPACGDLVFSTRIHSIRLRSTR